MAKNASLWRNWRGRHLVTIAAAEKRKRRNNVRSLPFSPSSMHRAHFAYSRESTDKSFSHILLSLSIRIATLFSFTLYPFTTHWARLLKMPSLVAIAFIRNQGEEEKPPKNEYAFGHLRENECLLTKFPLLIQFRKRALTNGLHLKEKAFIIIRSSTKRTIRVSGGYIWE